MTIPTPSRVRKRGKVIAYVTGGLLIPGAALAYGLLPASAAAAGPITGPGAKCVDVAGASSADGTAVQLFDCNGTGAQLWTVGNADNTIRALGKCLNVAASAVTNGARVQLATCTANAAQKWTPASGALVNTASGKCLDATNRGTANGTPLQIWSCTTAANQKFALPGGGGTPPVPPPATTPTTPMPPPATTPPTTTPPATTPPATRVNLDDPVKKDIAQQIVSTAENSSLDWRAQYKYIQDIKDGRGYTAGIIGFCSGTSDMLALVKKYRDVKPGNILAKYVDALEKVNGTDSHVGLDPTFVGDWKTAAADPVFQKAQEDERDRQYFNPSVRDGKADGLRALGQFAYYDAAVMHGYGGMRSIRTRAIARVKPPSQGGDEVAFLNAFMDERVIEMKKEEAHEDTTRVDTAQRVFLRNGNLDLNTPLVFSVYGEQFRIN
jgi:chitosanase